MHKGTEGLPVTPFLLQSSSSVQGAAIDNKQETKMTMMAPPMVTLTCKTKKYKILT